MEIASDSDERAVRRAYAAKLKVTNPEDDSDGFKKLRAAYETALQRSRRPSRAVQVARPVAVETALSNAHPATSPEAPTPEEQSFAANRDALLAALMSPRHGAEHLTTLFEAIVASPIMAQLTVHASCELWLAQIIAEHLPAADPLISPAIAIFGWRGGGHGYIPSPSASRVVQRARECEFIDSLRWSEAPLHRGWQSLTTKPAAAWRMRLRALNPRLPANVGAVLDVVAGTFPGLATSFDANALSWWRAFLARPRVGRDDVISSLVIVGYATALGAHLASDVNMPSAAVISAGLLLVAAALLLPLTSVAIGVSPQWQRARAVVLRTPAFATGWIPVAVVVPLLSVFAPQSSAMTLLIALLCLGLMVWCRLAVVPRAAPDQTLWRSLGPWLAACPAAVAILPGLLGPFEDSALSAIAIWLMLFALWQRGRDAMVTTAARLLSRHADIVLLAAAGALVAIGLLAPETWPIAPAAYRISVLTLLGLCFVFAAASLVRRPRVHRVAIWIVMLALLGAAAAQPVSAPAVVSASDDSSPPLLEPDGDRVAKRFAATVTPNDPSSAVPVTPVHPLNAPSTWLADLAVPPDVAVSSGSYTLVYEFKVDVEGRVVDCRIAESSGVPELDAAVCLAVVRNARFSSPAGSLMTILPSFSGTINLTTGSRKL